MENNSFTAKVNKKAKIYHHWRLTDVRELYEAICNPGLTRTKTELKSPSSKDKLCKVCEIHI